MKPRSCAARSGLPSLAWPRLTGLLLLTLALPSAHAKEDAAPRFRRVPLQFIAALADPSADSGGHAETWGIWRVDPGPRGVRLDRYSKLLADDGIAPAQWRFDPSDWWVEEHGLIMEAPDFPLPAGQYVVTGDREVTTVLTVYPPDDAGAQRWELAGGATLEDVTHRPCRSARYTPATNEATCSPEGAPRSAFPVSPGAPMPAIDGCRKQDYAVLFIIGVAIDAAETSPGAREAATSDAPGGSEG